MHRTVSGPGFYSTRVRQGHVQSKVPLIVPDFLKSGLEAPKAFLQNVSGSAAWCPRYVRSRLRDGPAIRRPAAVTSPEHPSASCGAGLENSGGRRLRDTPLARNSAGGRGWGGGGPRLLMWIPRHPPKQGCATRGKLMLTGAPDLGFRNVLRGSSASVCSCDHPLRRVGGEPRLRAKPSVRSSGCWPGSPRSAVHGSDLHRPHGERQPSRLGSVCSHNEAGVVTRTARQDSPSGPGDGHGGAALSVVRKGTAPDLRDWPV